MNHNKWLWYFHFSYLITNLTDKWLCDFCWHVKIILGHCLYQGHLVQQYFMLSLEIAVCLKHWIFCVIVIFASIPISLMTVSPFTTWHVNKKCYISILYHIVRRHLVFLLKKWVYTKTSLYLRLITCNYHRFIETFICNLQKIYF